MKKMYQSLSFICALCLFIACSSEHPPPPKKVDVAASQPEANPPAVAIPQKPECSLTLGWDPWEPYQYKNVERQVTGLDIELIKSLASLSECQLKFEQNDWKTLLKKIRQGEIDIVAGASVTPERENYAYFSLPYRDESFALYVRKGEADKYPTNNLREMLNEGHRLGVTLEYIYGDEITDLQNSPEFDSQFVGVDISEVNYVNLLDRKIDAFIEDPIVATHNIRRKGFNEKIELFPITISSGEVHLMFSQASVDKNVVDKFNQAINKIKDDGTYGEIVYKYKNL